MARYQKEASLELEKIEELASSFAIFYSFSLQSRLYSYQLGQQELVIFLCFSTECQRLPSSKTEVLSRKGLLFDRLDLVGLRLLADFLRFSLGLKGVYYLINYYLILFLYLILLQRYLDRRSTTSHSQSLCLRRQLFWWSTVAEFIQGRSFSYLKAQSAFLSRSSQSLRSLLDCRYLTLRSYQLSVSSTNSRLTFWLKGFSQFEFQSYYLEMRILRSFFSLSFRIYETLCSIGFSLWCSLIMAVMGLFTRKGFTTSWLSNLFRITQTLLSR